MSPRDGIKNKSNEGMEQISGELWQSSLAVFILYYYILLTITLLEYELFALNG